MEGVLADVAVETVGFMPVDFVAAVKFVGLFSRIVEVVELPFAQGVTDVMRVHGEDFILRNRAIIDKVAKEFNAEAQPSAARVVAVFISND